MVLWLAVFQLITALATAITVVVALVKSFHNGAKIDALTVNIDGNLHQLLALTEVSSVAKGRLDERTDAAAELALRTLSGGRTAPPAKD